MDRFTIINEQLQQLNCRKKLAKNRLMITCPFHDDNTPSCGILIGEDTKYEIGSFHCLGCGTHGNWNKLAQKLGLKTIGNDVPKSGSAHTEGLKMKMKDLDNSMLSLGSSNIDEFMKEMGGSAYTEWPSTVEWRGFPGWLINNLGAQIATMSRGELFCFFPVVIGKDIQGLVRARIEPSPGKNNYLTTEGEWIKTKGLFPFSFVRLMLKKMVFKYVILVEGPRDALRLIMNGIPALAILGSQNLSASKMDLLMQLGVELVIALPDNDKAGRSVIDAIKSLHSKTQRGYDLDCIKLPRPKDEEGKLIKIDPGNMDRDLLEALFDVIEDHGGSRIKRSILKTISVKEKGA